MKITFAGLYLLSAPILVGAFLLYWKQCITWAYDVFAICEYCGVFLNICFHGCAFFDIRYKVCFRQTKIDHVLLRKWSGKLVTTNSPAKSWLRSLLVFQTVKQKSNILRTA
ncbi:unnamed protein product [Haemonchus placei]|uniref:CWH43-like N-terminal domain-containing protein n=1 Tax=Haemonchus placei TaxID=6290 RepID=A0A3P8AHC4_HAEPC|nr:unnamed protein product [Haemonchus placei]